MFGALSFVNFVHSFVYFSVLKLVGIQVKVHASCMVAGGCQAAYCVLSVLTGWGDSSDHLYYGDDFLCSGGMHPFLEKKLTKSLPQLGFEP